MMSFGAQRRVFVSTRPVDFRKGLNGLAGLVAESLKSNPYNGDIYVFRAKRKDRLKLLLFDGTGMILATKWLEKDGFAWPPIADGAISLTATQWAMLFEGLEGWSRIERKDIRRPTKVA